MMRNFVFLLIILNSALCFAAGNPEAGKLKSVTCAACHGSNGISTNPEWPSLAGQHVDYLVKQLQYFKEGKKRQAILMQAPVANLTQQDIEDLAAYYNSLPRPKGLTPKKYLKPGEQLYRGGNFTKHITACIACHGPQGLGNAQAGFPVLSGQQPAYIIQTLKNYQDGTRTSDINSIMRDIAARMSKEDMAAAAYYVSGLH